MGSSSSFVALGNALIARGRILYFRLSVPRRLRGSVGTTEIKLSLRTPYIEEGRAIARLLSGKAQEVFHLLDRGAYRDMDKALVKALVIKHMREVLDSDEYLRASYEEPIGEEELEHFSRASALFAESDKGELARYDYASIEPVAGKLIASAEKDGICMEEFKKGTTPYRYLCRELLKSRAKIFETYIKRNAGEYDDYDFSAFAASPSAFSNTNHGGAIAEQQTKPLPRLSKAADTYIKENSTAERGKANWTSEKTTLQHVTTINRIIAAVGDIPIHQLRLEHVERFRDYMFIMPANMQKKPRYKDKTYEELMVMEIPEQDKAKDQTIKNNFIRANTFLRWLGTKYQLALRFDGILGINLQQNPDEERLPFSTDDLKRLFHSPRYVNQELNKAAHFWVPLLGLFTGARLEELCQLYLKDFGRTPDGVWYISISPDEDKRLKNMTAKRKVPLHDELIRLGLIERVEYLKSHGVDRLFPELTKTGKLSRYGGPVSQWFTRFRREEGVGIGDEEGKKTFHSFRHTMADYFKQKGFQGTPTWATLQNVIGHSSGDDETTARYSHKINPDVAYERIMKQLQYDLNLDHLLHSKYIHLIDKDRQVHRKK